MRDYAPRPNERVGQPGTGSQGLRRRHDAEGPTSTETDERVERRLQRLQQLVADFEKATTAELEKRARSAAHDRGRLRKIEDNLERLLQLLLDKESRSKRGRTT